MITKNQQLRNDYNLLLEVDKFDTEVIHQRFNDYTTKNFENDEILEGITDLYFEWCMDLNEPDLFRDGEDFQNEFMWGFLKSYQYKLGWTLTNQ